ncbi:MAG TPA: hypothetical protein GX707_05875 [Epulopiscium sp.]|nr:hypothetical protein [Candidatus Epulonipiscium sp.]
MHIVNASGIGVNKDMSYAQKNTVLEVTPLKLPVPNGPSIDDTISISDEAKALLEEEQDKKALFNNYSPAELEAMFEQFKVATDDSDNPLKIQLQCLKIAMRIMSGDNVPNKDRAFLAEHDPGMLGRAMLLRRQKEKPKDHKSVLEDDKSDKPTNPSAPISSKASQGAPAESVSSDATTLSPDIEVSVHIEA